VWNSLPAAIRQITSYGQFRQHLKPCTLIPGLEIAAHCESRDKIVHKINYTITIYYCPAHGGYTVCAIHILLLTYLHGPDPARPRTPWAADLLETGADSADFVWSGKVWSRPSS